MREKNICPWCGKEGDPVEIIMNKPTRWACECGPNPVYPYHVWDINDDFDCLMCGKEVPGGICCCSPECEDAARKAGIL